MFDRRGLRETAGIDSLRSKNVGIFRNLLLEGAIISKGYDPVAAVHKLSANVRVTCSLGRLVVD